MNVRDASAEARLKYTPSLTGLRGVAASAVVIFHLWIIAGRPTLTILGYPAYSLAACGFLGVDLFFVLSGFLLASPFLAASAKHGRWPLLSAFFFRRAARILPAFWTQIAVLYVIGWAVLGHPPVDVRTILAHALFAQQLVAGVGVINPVYWSLPVEWWFYFYLPLIAWMFGRARWWLLLALFAVFAIDFRIRCWQWLNEGQWDTWNNYGAIMGLRARLDEFFLGVLAAWANLHTPRHSRRRSVAISIGALALVALLPSIAARGDLFVRADYPWLLIHYDVVGVLLALIVFGAAGAGRWSSVVLANRPILGLGMISFSVYLWHYPVFQWSVALGLWGYTSRFTAAVIVVLATLAIAWISYECIESRFLRKDVVAE